MAQDLRAGAGLSVQISNVNGKIEVEPSTGTSVEVVALKSAKGANAAAAKEAIERIEIREDVSPSSISIETKLPRGGGWFQMGPAQVKYTVVSRSESRRSSRRSTAASRFPASPGA